MSTSAHRTAGWRRAAALLVLAAATRAAAQEDGVPAKRLAALARGVNISHLAWRPAETVQEDRARTLEPNDAAVIRGIGMTHVRLAIHPPAVWSERQHAFNPEGLHRVKAAIGVLLHGGLAVVVDAHAGLEMGWAMPDQRTGRAEELERFWNALATELSGTDPDRVFLEILNEPHGTTDNGELWGAAQEKLAVVIRAAAPRHTIIATGDDWGSIDGLKRLKPLDDRNIVYSFHVYEPHTFTHQGTAWGSPPWRYIRGLDYPARKDNANTVAAYIGSGDEDRTKAVEEVRQYAADMWDAARVRARIAEAAAWGKEHGRPLYCGEFGAYRPFAPAGSRIAWIEDARRALEESGAGWAMWEYRGDFGLLEGQPGSRKTDEGVLRALGLRK